MLIEWKGLGYYRRARSLLAAAKQINSEFGGEIPLDFEKLTSIKGIGPYTASALLSIGADKKALAVDANLERVLSRYYGIKTNKGPKLQKELQSQFERGEIASDIDKFGARALNEALMDLGRSICKARSAACEICPLQKKCIARMQGAALEYPIAKVESKTDAQKGLSLSLLRVVVEKEGKLLAFKKNEKEWLSFQYEIPTFILNSEDETLDQYPKIDMEHLLFLPSFRTGITKYKIDNYVLYMDYKEFEKSFKISKRMDWLSDRTKLSTSSQKTLKALE